jgi:glycosyltransferase involved in cell wall biosynthesis
MVRGKNCGFRVDRLAIQELNRNPVLTQDSVFMSVSGITPEQSFVSVCVVVPSYYPATIYGGPIISIHSTCRELAKRGVEVFVSTTNANGNKKLAVKPNDVVQFDERYRVKYYDDTIIGRFSWRFMVAVWRDIRSCNLVRIEDIFSSYIPIALFYAKLFRKPFIVSPRGSLSAWSLESKRPLLKKLWSALLIKPFLRGSWWHATSQQESVEIKAYYPAARVVVIPNGIDLDEFAKPATLSRREYVRRFTQLDSDGGPVIVSMGRLHRKKGFDVLIDAFAELRRVHANAVLLIAGADDGEKAALQQQVESLSLQGLVFFVGEVVGADKVSFLSGGDLFVLPSHSENFGNVYLEALACGVPIVASRETPWEEAERFGCGKWVENSVAATSVAMLELLGGDRIAMAARAKEMAARYTWVHVAKRFQETFALMLNDEAPRLGRA